MNAPIQKINGKSLDSLLSQYESEMAAGISYTHSRITFNTRKTLESSSFLYALIELLGEKGILPISEVDERKKKVAQRLVRKFEESRIGLLYQDPEEDKYSFNKDPNIDCSSCLEDCKAVCCKLPFALSKQDVHEGIIRWEFGRPYLIAHDPEGYCVHMNRETYRCTAYENRPVPCRGFSCRNNEKWPVWKDFNNKELNPEFEQFVKESNERMYHCDL